MKIVINTHGGFGLSDAAYEKLIEWGIPVRGFADQGRDQETGLYKKQPLNDEGEIIFDRDLRKPTSAHEAILDQAMRHLSGRYWDVWLDKRRDHPLLIRVVEELGNAANGKCAALKVIEIPDGVEWEIEEYDGREWVSEKHRTWS